MYSTDQLAEVGLDDFRVFLCEVWAFLDLPDPTPLQLDVAYNLQHGAGSIVIEAFRGEGKSWKTVAFVLWLLLHNPQRKILVVSANQNLADNFSKFAKQLIHGMPLLAHLKAREGQRDSAIEFDVGPARPSKDPSVKSVGITGQITGSRADVIVADDIEIPKNSYTFTLRERTRQLVQEFTALLRPEGDRRIIYLGTPQIEDSLYTWLAKERGYTIMVWPLLIPERPEVYQGRLAPYIQRMIDRGVPAGTCVEPGRFTPAIVREKQMEYSDSGFALQFMLDTSPADADRYPLKLSDLMVMDVDREMAPVQVAWGRTKAINDLQAGGLDGDAYYAPVWNSDERTRFTGTVMAVDPSGMGSDETAYAIVKFCSGQLYLVDSGGFTDGFGEDTLSALAARAGRHGVTDYIDETNYGGGMFTSLITPHLHRYGITRIKPDDWDGWSRGQKERRVVDTLEPILKSHRLVVDRSLIERDIRQQHDNAKYSLVQQLTRLTRTKGALAHDDRIEAVAMACAYWTVRMDRDQTKLLQKHKADLVDMELRKFVEGVTGTGRLAHYNYAQRR